MRIKNSIRKTRHHCNKKKEEIKKTEETILREKKNLPINYNCSINVTESGIMGLSGGRNKGIDEIENEIVDLRVEANGL